MEYIIMAVSIQPRNMSAPKVQEVLTKHGCIIKTRLGLHDLTENSCSQNGLILLQLYHKADEVEVLKKDLEAIDGVKVNTMSI